MIDIKYLSLILAVAITACSDDPTGMGDVSVKFQAWWDRMAAKYKWEKISGKKWGRGFLPPLGQSTVLTCY